MIIHTLEEMRNTNQTDWVAAFAVAGDAKALPHVAEVYDNYFRDEWNGKDNDDPFSRRSDTGDGDCLCLGRMDDGRYFKMFAGWYYTCPNCGFGANGSGNIEYYETREELYSPNTLLQSEAYNLGIEWNP